MDKEKKKILVIGALAVGAYFIFFKKETAANTSELQGGYEDYLTEESPYVAPTGAFSLMGPIGKEAYMNLQKYVGANAAWSAAFDKMSELELIKSWEYVWSFYLRNKKLYRLPGPTGVYADGGWNTQLFDSIAAIKNKYAIF